MADHNNFLDRIATLEIEERVARHQVPGQRRPRLRGRHALAHRLHHLADRLDGGSH